MSTYLYAVEALPGDAGRGIARIDPQDMYLAHIKTGDVIRISGRAVTVALAMPLSSQDRGRKIIRLDAVARPNAQLLLRSNVLVERADSQRAKWVRLGVMPSPQIMGGMEVRLAEPSLRGQPVVVGETIRVALSPTHSPELRIEETFPQGVVIVDQSTEIDVDSAPAEGAEIGEGYEFWLFLMALRLRRGKALTRDVDLSFLASHTEGCTGADIEFICRRAVELAVEEFLACL